jgi:hypothetical protein
VADRFISFQARDVDARQLNDVLSHYVEYERLRIFRHHLTVRLGCLLLLGWLSSLELHLLPGMAVIGTGAAVVAIITGVVLAERRARRIFTTFLRGSKVFKEEAPRTPEWRRGGTSYWGESGTVR